MDSGYEDVQRKLDEVIKSIQRLQESFDSLAAMVTALEPVLHEYKLQQEMYALRWKVSHTDLARQLDELEKLGK